MSTLGITLLAVFLACLGLWWLFARRKELRLLRGRGVLTDAVVVASCPLPEPENWEVAFRYSLPSGDTFVCNDYISVGPLGKGPEVGTIVKIFYSPSAPKDARMPESIF